MENARLIEILKLLRKEFKNKQNNAGICFRLREMYRNDKINLGERINVLDILEANKPTNHNEFKEFTYYDNWLNPKSVDTFWWVTQANDPKGNEVRYKYLTKLIKHFEEPSKFQQFINNIIWKFSIK